MKTDILVIGSGIAGLSLAIKLAEARPDLSVHILTKKNKEASNTAHAQGGMAVVLDSLKDSFEQHITDTLKAGKQLNNKKIVEMVVSQAPERLIELVNWGARFDERESGEFELGLEGGHSQRRIVHHQDLTGLEIHRCLAKKAGSFPNIHFLDHYFAIDLLIGSTNGNDFCTGVRMLDTRKNREINFYSKVTFLATGGCGRLFQNTTNPAVATADGIGMASRAGADIRNMNFIQFHPTAVYEKNKHPLFLISEAVRGFGAYVVNHNGNRFLFQSDVRGELATRDIVSKAIVKELKASGKKAVFLDCRHLDFEKFQNLFPTIVAYCLSIGINIKTDLIPIVPAAHYQCGGIQVDQYARTSIRNLYASGECAHTGLHGANRLASNSLLEALVFSHQASEAILQELDRIPEVREDETPEIVYSEEADEEIIESLRLRLNEIMTYDLVHASEKKEKRKVLRYLREVELLIENYPDFQSGTVAFHELRNMLATAVLIIEQAIDFSSRKRNIPEGIA